MTADQDARYIPWLIVLFFVVISLVLGSFCYIAQKTHTGVVTEQAYEKGLRYNDVIEQSSLQEQTGYRAVINHGSNKITFILTDAGGKNIESNGVSLWLFRPVQAGMDYHMTMVRDEQGRYVADITSVEKGLWEIRIHAQTPKGPYQATKRVVLE